MTALHTTGNIACEAMNAARAGERVAILADTLAAAQRFAGQAFELVHPEDHADVRKTNGNAQIRFRAGGRVHFRSLRQTAGRGLALDRAYVPASIDHADAEVVAPCLATSKNPQMIGYFPE